MEDLEDVLRNHGYRLHERLVGWWEVLAVRGFERWIGVGGTRAEALEDLWHRMCPSDLSRAMGQRNQPVARPVVDPVSNEAPEAAEADDLAPQAGTDIPGAGRSGDEPGPSLPDPETGCPDVLEEVPAVDVPHDPVALEPADVDRSSLEPETAPEPEPPVIGPVEPAAPTVAGEEPLPVEASPGATETSLEVVPEAAIAPAVPAGSPQPQEMPVMVPSSPRSVREEVDGILDEIRQQEAGFGMLAPVRQRLLITWWVARLRDLERQGHHPADVRRRIVEAVEKGVTMAGIYWPGSIPILNRDADPARAIRVIPGARRATTWQEVAAAACQALKEEEAHPGLDEDGWGDQAAMEPRCTYATDLLRQVHREIRHGPGGDMTAKPGPLPSEWHHVDKKKQDQVLRWAMSLRWIRQDVVDGIAWAQAMGRLRWLQDQWRHVYNLPKEFQKSLEEALDPLHCPRLPWAKRLGRDPGRKAIRARRQNLYRWFQALDVADSEEVARWFLEAARDLGIEIIQEWFQQRPEVLECIRNHPPAKKDLETLSKTQRRRVRRLIQGEVDLLPDQVLELGAGEEGPNGEGVSAAVPDDENGQEDGPVVPPPVRAFTEGKAALFVGNRNDPDLATTLKSLLGLGRLDLEEGTKPQRRDGLVDRIAGGTYQFVLAATGFLSHQADQTLLPACRQAGVPYLRVGKGRPMAVVRAIAHHLGVSAVAPATG